MLYAYVRQTQLCYYVKYLIIHITKLHVSAIDIRHHQVVRHENVLASYTSNIDLRGW
jgi:hypothetical protein